MYVTATVIAIHYRYIVYVHTYVAIIYIYIYIYIYVAGVWKTYHLHTCKIIRISNFAACDSNPNANHNYFFG